MKDILIGGVDEAGRGSIIGPLVIAGVSMRTSNIQRLRILGVRDSKLLSRKSRGNFSVISRSWLNQFASLYLTAERSMKTLP